MAVLFCLFISVLLASAESVSSKLDFEESETTSAANSTKIEDEDVEVKHTIVVSTKLRNNNRRGLHSSSDPDTGSLIYDTRTPGKKVEDSSEVPIVFGYKSVDSTQIRTPDTRFKNKVYPDSVFINRNIRDQYDPYPNSATNPFQWKPSDFFKNVNWWGQDGNDVYNRRNDAPENRGTVKFHRKLTDDGMKEFYCRRCRELSGDGEGSVGCAQRRNSWVYQTTTPKMKLDGKLAKLN